ncbi:unnamed protein product, partial [Prorocentrum cordatum]
STFSLPPLVLAAGPRSSVSGWRLGPRPGTRPSRASGATARRRCAPVAGGRMRRWPPATRPGARSWRRPWQSGTSWSDRGGPSSPRGQRGPRGAFSHDLLSESGAGPLYYVLFVNHLVAHS